MRNRARLAAVRDLMDAGAQAVVGELADTNETRELAEQANALRRMDAVIHDAGVNRGRAMMTVNVVAPYLLTALIRRPSRLSSSRSKLSSSWPTTGWCRTSCRRLLPSSK